MISLYAISLIQLAPMPLSLTGFTDGRKIVRISKVTNAVSPKKSFFFGDMVFFVLDVHIAYCTVVYDGVCSGVTLF